METKTSTSVVQGSNACNESISAVHPDIIESHIVTRLDGPSLASFACSSSQLRALSTQENIWRNICSSTWPSIDHPRVQNIISTFPSGHRSFFSDSFPFPFPQSSKQSVNSRKTIPTELISAVDIYYRNEVIYSKVDEMETSNSWLLCSPFRVDLFGQKDSSPTPVKNLAGSKLDEWLKHLEENLSLSWILIDPSRKKAVNISSRRAVSVRRHWLTGDVQVRFGTVIAGDGWPGSARELLECGVVVTCGGKEGGNMHVREVSMMMEDMDGKSLNGKDSLAIIEGLMESERRKGNGNEGKEKYEKFEERKRERKQTKQSKERAVDLVCITVGVAGFVAFWSAVLFR